MIPLKDKRIFIAEDNLQNRIVYQMTLLRHGADGEFEKQGKGTLLRLNGMSHVDLIVLDLMLADGISGFDLFDQIRAIPRFANVPIIAVSAMDASVAIPKVKDKGFAGFIAKPVDPNLFPKQLAAIMAGEQVWYTGDRIW